MWTWVEAMQAALHEGQPGGNRIKDRVWASCSRLAEMDCGGISQGTEGTAACHPCLRPPSGGRTGTHIGPWRLARC